MVVLRLAKTAMVAAVAAFATVVAFDNVTDYGTNFVFVQHVLSMDTILPGSTIGYRAITSPALRHAAYALIIAAEAPPARCAGSACWRSCASGTPPRPRSIAPRRGRSPD
jgi:predicted small integral membrane protein